MVSTPSTLSTAAPAGVEEEMPRSQVRAVLRVLVLLLGALLLLLLVESAIAGFALRAAAGDARATRAALKDADVARAADGVVALKGHLGTARTSLRGPQWILPQALPWVGDDLKAVRLTVFALDDTVDGTVEPLVGLAGTLRDGLRRGDGSLDTDRLAVLRGQIDNSAAPAARSALALHRINLEGVNGLIREQLAQARQAVDLVDRSVRTSQDGLLVAETMLGARQQATTLVGVQNPAEARGTGGIIGAVALTTADRGRMQLTSTTVNDDLLPYRTPASDLPAELTALYGRQVRDVRNVNLSPDFPAAAALLAGTYQRYARAGGGPVPPARTSVVTLTPKALAQLLAATGPVTVPGRPQLTSANAVRVLESDIYRDIPDLDERSAYVEAALAAVFQAVASGRVKDELDLVRALGKSASAGDLMAWSPDPKVQAALSRMGAAGDLGQPEGSELRLSWVNSDGSKLDYWTNVTTTLRGGDVVLIDVRNDAPSTVADYVRNHLPGAAATTHAITLQLHLPQDIGVRAVSVDGRPVRVQAGGEQGWAVVRLPLVVARGQTRSVRLELEGRPATAVRVAAAAAPAPVRVEP